MKTGRREPVALAGAILLTLVSGIWAVVALGPDEVAPETVSQVAHAQVLSATGAHAARAGERLHAGDTLTTADTGSATVLSPGRRLLVGPKTTVRIGASGAPTYDLRGGSIGLDVERGRPVSVRADQVTATTRTTPSILRVDRPSSVRVASLVGASELAVPTGGSLSLGTLDEAVVLGVALPPKSAPVSQVDASPAGIDAALVPALSQAQGSLLRLAGQVDADPLAPVLFRVSDASAPASEQALPQAIGTAGAAGSDRGARIARALALRGAAAAWAVIAAELQAPVTGVTGVLSDLLTPPDQVATAPVPVAGSGSLGSGTSRAPSPPPSSSPRPSSTPQTRPTRARASPTPGSGTRPSNPAPSPSPSTAGPSPSPTPGLVGGLLGTVSTLLSPVPLPSLVP